MSFISVILEWLYPRRCAFCHKLTEDNVLLCSMCEKRLPFTRSAAAQELPHIKKCVSPLFYVDDVRSSILRYKFKGTTGYCKVYAELLAKCIDENKIFCDIITWVPLSRKKLRRRGYNQTELIAKELSKLTGMPCLCLIEKFKDNSAQSGINDAGARRKNVSGVYRLSAEASGQGGRVLVIDDVVTTGATLSECARTLKKGNFSEIYAATVARKRI